MLELLVISNKKIKDINLSAHAKQQHLQLLKFQWLARKEQSKEMYK